MKKRIISVVLLLCMTVSAFAGCKAEYEKEESYEIPDVDGIYSGKVTVKNMTTGEEKALEGYDAEYLLYAFNSMRREKKNTGTSAEYLIKLGDAEIYYNLHGVGNDVTNGTVTGLNQKRRPTVDEILERNVGKPNPTVSGIVRLDVGRLGNWVTLTEEESKEVCDFLNSLTFVEREPCCCVLQHRLTVSGYGFSFEEKEIRGLSGIASDPDCELERIVEKYLSEYNSWITVDDIPDVEGIYSGEVTVKNMATGVEKVLNGYDEKYLLYAFNTMEHRNENNGTSAEYLIKFGKAEIYYNLHGIGNDITNGLCMTLNKSVRPTVDEIIKRRVGEAKYKLSGVVKLDVDRMGEWVTLTEEESKQVCDFLNSLTFVEREPCECVLRHRLTVSGYEIAFEEKEIRGLSGIASDPDCELERIVEKYLSDTNPECQYTPLTCPTSSATVYGKVTEINALAFDDVWGLWEVVSEGENSGAVHSLPGTGACMIIINNVDFSNAKKVTLSADVMLPSKKDGNNNYGLVMDVWTDDEEDMRFYWETEYNSYYYLLCSGSDTGTLIGKWGASTVLGSESNGWTSFNDSHGVDSPKVDGISFEYGKYTNIKCIWDIENDALELYYDGQLTKKVDFNESTFKFTNEGDNVCGLRSNRDDVYFKNINLIVEGDVTAEATPEEGKENNPEDKYEDLPEDKPEDEEQQKLPYVPFTSPLSTSTVYGITTEKNALSFNDVWGAWEVVSEGEHEGALHLIADSMTGLALVNNVDFTKANKITISADIMLPEKASMGNDVGFVMNMWISPGDDQYFHWTDDFVSYFYCFNTGFGKNSCMIGKWGETKAELKYKKGLHTFEKVDGIVESKVEKVDFKYGEYFNLKAVWDVENYSLAVYCDGQLYQTIDFDSNPFTNEGDNGIGLRANRGDVYFKNIDLIVE